MHSTNPPGAGQSPHKKHREAEGMRKDTIRLCEYVVAGLENTYLDNPDEKPIELEAAIEY